MIRKPRTFGHLFYNSMKRVADVDYLRQPPSGAHINLGSGNSPIKGCYNLDRPDWEAPSLGVFEDDSIACVHAYHFFEHLAPDTLYEMLSEIHRVLKHQGVVNYCVPYAMAPIAFMDVTHRTFWTEETMRTLVQSRGYESRASRFVIERQMIAGIDSQNLAVIGQLTKYDVNRIGKE